MSLHFLQMATQWLGSEEVLLANAAITLCRAVRYRGIRDLTLPLANGLLKVLHADMMPAVRPFVLGLLESCHAIYEHLSVTAVIALLESVMSWKERKMQVRARSTAAYILETIMMDDGAFAVVNHHITSMVLAEQRGNMDETAAKYQKLIGLLSESKAI